MGKEKLFSIFKKLEKRIAKTPLGKKLPGFDESPGSDKKDILVENKESRKIKSDFYSQETFELLENAIDEFEQIPKLKLGKKEEHMVDSKAKMKDLAELVKPELYNLLDCSQLKKDPRLVVINPESKFDKLKKLPPELAVPTILGGIAGSIVIGPLAGAGLLGLGLSTGLFINEKDDSYAFYMRLSNTLVVPHDKSNLLTYVLAHEYTHAIQRENGMADKSKLLREGHADAVGLDVTMKIAEKTDNQSLYDMGRLRKHQRLIRAYQELCNHTGNEHKFKTKLYKKGTSKPAKMSIYDMGVSLFEIARQNSDDSIYKDVLSNDLSKVTAKNGLYSILSSLL